MLLLDEPTNDLDFAGLARLGEALAGFRGGLVAVSRDRAFLAGMARILEFEAETRRVRVYAGGWAEFEAERRRALEAEARAYRDYSTARDRVVERARRKREWNERGYGQGRKKKKTKDARKAFEQELGRLERVEKPWSPWRLELDLDAASRPGARSSPGSSGPWSAAATSASARSTSRSRAARPRRGAWAPNGAGQDDAAAVALLGRAAAARRASGRWVGPSAVLRRARRRARAGFAGDRSALLERVRSPRPA